MPDAVPGLTRFKRELRRAIAARKWTAADVEAEAHGAPVAQWLRDDATPLPHHIAVVEGALGLSPGQLSRHLGFVPVGVRPVVVRRPLLDVDQAAEYLSTTPRHMRRLVNERRIAFVKIGRKVRFRQTELDRFIQQHERQAQW